MFILRYVSGTTIRARVYCVTMTSEFVDVDIYMHLVDQHRDILEAFTFDRGFSFSFMSTTEQKKKTRSSVISRKKIGEFKNQILQMKILDVSSTFRLAKAN